MPNTAAVTGDLTSLISTTPALQEPVYNIMDFRLEDGQVELTAVAQDKPSEPVRISVPISMASQALNEKISKLSTLQTDKGTMSSTLGASETAVPNLDKLLNATNLRTMSISQEARHVSDAQSADKNVVATESTSAALISEDSGARFAITSKINRSNVAAKSDADALTNDRAEPRRADSDEVTSSGKSSVSRASDNIDLLPLRRVQVVSKSYKRTAFLSATMMPRLKWTRP
jgi:hypothetical protein